MADGLDFGDLVSLDYAPDFGGVATQIDLPQLMLPTLDSPAFDTGQYQMNPSAYSLGGVGPSQNTSIPVADVLGNYGGGRGGGPYSVNESVVMPSGGGGGDGKGLLDTFGNVARNVLPAAQLGLQGMGMYQGFRNMQAASDQAGLVRDAQRRQAQIAAQQQALASTAESRANPAFEAGQEALVRAQRGEVPPAVEAQIQEWTRAAKQQAMASAASRGQSNSTTATSWLQWIDRQAQAMRGQWIQQQMNWSLEAARTGNQGLQVGAQSLSGAASTTGASQQFASQQQNELNNLMAQANQVLSRLNASAV